MLSKSASLDAFQTTWERMCKNHTMWETVVRPHVDEEKQCVYVLKTFEDRHDSPPRDASSHPFFSPKSVEAERYLEKHDEMQRLRDNTVSIRKVTKTVSQMMEESMEKYCKLAFSTEKIAFPTCLMLLPYGLNFDQSVGRPVAAANPRLLSCAVRLGNCLLENNKATARLSFCLMMSGRMRGPDGNEFKAQMQEWLKRARYESCASIAMEIVEGLGCGGD